MKRITGQTSEANRGSQVSSITNDAYINQGKNKTVNYESALSYQSNSYQQTTIEKPKSHHVSYTGRSSTINPDTEFTNSFTLEEVSEPYRSNIRSIKVRARTSRTAVGQSFIH